jgi:TolB protein
MKKILALFLFLVGFHASALLHLVLTQGVDTALPIQVLPFEAPKAAVSSVIGNDLVGSGRFRLVGEAPQNIPRNAQTLDKNYFKKQGANYLIGGSVEETGNMLKVNVFLVDVYAANMPVLLSQNFTAPVSDYRGLSHAISDAIYQKILGERGIFSTKIAYIWVSTPQSGAPTYKLMVADYDGFDAQAVLISKEPIMSPAWSPDGKSIAYVSFENRLSAIYISELATGKRKLISQLPGINGSPTFSPDGKKLAMVLSKLDQPNVYIVDLSTGQLIQMTKGYAITTEPVFSPDGNSLLLTSDRGGTPQIYQVNIANKALTRVTYQGNYNAQADYVPGANSIVYLHRGEDTGGRFGIATQDLSTNDVIVLAADGDQSPSVSPNGEMVIYTIVEKNGQTTLAMVSIDGKIHLDMPSQEGGVVREPTWGPYS